MVEITVIIPVYNAEKYIGECLQSLYRQSFKNSEVLVINDSSTDDTVNVVKDFIKGHEDFNLKIVTVPNGGAAKARNEGINLATGKYIFFMDADDIADNRMLQTMIEEAYKIDADLITCDFYWMFSDHNKREKLFAPKTARDLFIAAWAAPWNKLYKKSMLIDNDVYFTEGFTYEDTAFYLKYIPFCRTVKHIPIPFIYWRQHNTSTMGRNQNKRVPQIFSVLEDAISFYKVHGVYSLYEKELEYFCAKLLWGSSIYRICQVRDRKERKYYIKMTISWLEKYFPNWKANEGFKRGLRGIYMQSINAITADIYANCIYYIRYYGRNKM